MPAEGCKHALHAYICNDRDQATCNAEGERQMRSDTCKAFHPVSQRCAGKQATQTRPGSVSLYGMEIHRGLNAAVFSHSRRAWQAPGRVTWTLQAVIMQPSMDTPVPIKPQPQEPLVLTRKTQGARLLSWLRVQHTKSSSL